MPERPQSRSWTGRLALVAFLMATALSAAEAEAVAPAAGFSWTAFLGPFHHVVLHLPIGFIALLLVLEVACWFKPEPVLRRIVCLVTHLTTGSAIVTVTLGLMLENSGGFEPTTLGNHELAGKVVAGFAIAASIAVFFVRRNPFNRSLLWTFRALVAGMAVAVSVAGHFGGNLAHGSTYLTRNAPAFLRRWIESEPTTPAPIAAQGSATAIFQERCVQCHGAEKQKGDLRLDSWSAVLAGGENGPVVVPGKPMKSVLVELITLPPDDDDVMPPKGKGRLTADEILTIIRWIEAGAKE